MISKPTSVIINDRKYRVIEPSRLYCGYNVNTIPTALTQDQWVPFSYPSEPIEVYRNKDFSIDPSQVRFTYTGSDPKFFEISVVCNIKKTTKGGSSRDIEFQWRLNGTGVGPIRETHMSSKDAEIISGSGQLLLSNGDYIEPYIRNIENSDDCVLYNCAYNIKEDITVALNN